MRSAGTIAFGLAYIFATLALAVWGAAIAEFHCYETTCEGSDWTTQTDAWQWDVLIALSAVGGLVGLVTLVVTLSISRPLLGAIGLGLHAALVLAVGASLEQAENLSAAQVVLWLLLVLVPGAGLIYLRASRQTAGTLRE